MLSKVIGGSGFRVIATEPTSSEATPLAPKCPVYTIAQLRVMRAVREGRIAGLFPFHGGAA